MVFLVYYIYLPGTKYKKHYLIHGEEICRLQTLIELMQFVQIQVQILHSITDPNTLNQQPTLCNIYNHSSDTGQN